jgi:hydrogenase expression/formation protein HypE
MTCPAPVRPRDKIQLAHGGGGRLMRDLIETVFRPALSGATLDDRHDAAALEAPAGRLAFTTDSFVVQPIFFPGGDIGSLAVHGTVNDLAMAGARPLALSAAFILEEGFPVADLERVSASMGRAAAACGVQIVTGDTKVVDRGKGDGVFVTTTGIGVIPDGVEVHPGRIRPGDQVLLSGDLGRHGIAVMSVREGIAFETTVESDSAPLHQVVAALLEAGVEVHCLRDLTRGGLASALNELAMDAAVSFELVEDSIPVHPGVAGACELLGLDPLYVANEGRFIAVVSAASSGAALEVLRTHAPGEGAARIGEVSASDPGRVTLRGRIGGRRLLDLLSGEQLPRIC